MRKNIPNFITCLNLIAGSLAVIFAFYKQLDYAVAFIFVAAVLDFLDGMAARLLNAYSHIGKDLDSLADMISFGFAPGMIMFMLLKYSFPENNLSSDGLHDFSLTQKLTMALSLLIPVFSALRLAIFNNDTRQVSSFIGLPTPADAIFICSLAMISVHGRFPAFDSMLLSTPSLAVITLLLSFLLVSNIPMFSLKFKNLTWKDNKIRFSFLLSSAVLIAFLQFYGLTAAIVLYVLLSIGTKLKK